MAAAAASQNLGLQLGSAHNLFDWEKAAGYAEKGITVGAKTWCEVHGCLLVNLGTDIAGFTGTGLQLGSTHNLGSISGAASGSIHWGQNLGTTIGGFTGTGLQLGSASNLNWPFSHH